MQFCELFVPDRVLSQLNKFFPLSDAKILNEVQDRFEVDITELPEEIDLSSYIEGR